jgi:hypothetical protein
MRGILIAVPLGIGLWIGLVWATYSIMEWIR